LFGAADFAFEVFGAGLGESVDPFVESALGYDPSAAEFHGGDLAGSDELVGGAEREQEELGGFLDGVDDPAEGVGVTVAPWSVSSPG
jgi:hypothetical protein